MSKASALALRRPKTVLASWLALAAFLAILGLDVESRLTQSILVIPGTESDRAVQLATDEFGQSVTTPILLEGPSRELDRQGPALVEKLSRRDDIRVISPWDRGAGTEQLRPKPSAAMIVAALERPYREAFDQLAPKIREFVEERVEAPVNARVTGMAAIGNGLKEESYSAARRAERVAVPVLILVLLLVFRSPVAAAIPAATGLTTVLSAFGGIWILASIWDIDPIATSLASMMGLALGVDYSLLLVSRFREELQAGRDPPAAAGIAARTAGRTVIFAGAALVLAMLVATLLSPGDLLLSAAIGVIVATLLSVGAALLAIPAALVLVGSNVNRWQLRRRSGGRDWMALLRRPLRRPGAAAAVILLPLLLISAPALALDTGPPDVRQLPPDSEARIDFEQVRDVMGAGWAAPFDVIIASENGTITTRRRLREIEEWQDEITDINGVSQVVGPGRLRPQAEKLRGTERSLAKAESALADLERGLARAGGGVETLRGGLSEAADGAGQLSYGASRAADGTARLEGSLGAGSEGATRITDALARAEDGAGELASGAERASAGAERLAEALTEVRGRVADEALPGLRELASGLSSGSEQLGRLREPVQVGERELAEAYQALSAMGVGKSDPQYAEALESVARASGAISGRDPITGTQVRPDYDGLDAELATGEQQLADAAAGAEELVAGTEALVGGLDRIRGGADRLAGGLERLREGNRALAAGLGRLHDATGRFSGAIERLGGGAQRLIAGLERLDAGAAELAGGLDSGYLRSGELERGMVRLESGAERFHRRAADTRERQRRRSPRLFDSGYFVLSAIDGAPRRESEQASFAVNVERGGEAGRVMIVPEGGPNSEQNAQLREELSAAADDLARRTGTSTAVGGPGAQLTEYDEATSSRLVWLILALAAVTYLVLVPIFRSLVLPAVAVALNLVTVAASFGALAALFQGSDPILGGPGYIDAVAISAIYTVIFGLSIDYEVFLIARMREGYLASGDTDSGIEYGLRRTAGVVTGAAAIMTGVFLAFAMTEVANTRQFGVGLAVAVILDATVVRLLLLPAAMRLLGDRCWWIPEWLDRRLPELDVEGTASGERVGGARTEASA
jgi:putative drug exporter of the RND superfamily